MQGTALPTEAELRTLPCWARVALAARCARRVLPLFTNGWPDAPQSHAAAVANAVSVAEISASAAHEAADIAASAAHAARLAADAATRAAGEARGAVRDADRAAQATGVSSGVGSGRRAAARADGIARAARAATAARAAARAASASASVTYAVDAINLASRAADSPSTDAAIRADFDRLFAIASAEIWLDATPVPPQCFGPLQSDAAPISAPATQTDRVR